MNPNQIVFNFKGKERARFEYRDGDDTRTAETKRVITNFSGVCH
jgi:hypothetical protein